MPGNSSYFAEYLPAAVKDIKTLSPHIKKLLECAIEERLTIDPIGFGKPLQHTLKGYRRLRVGDYRIVFRIEDATKTVLILALKHRKEIYEKFMCSLFTFITV